MAGPLPRIVAAAALALALTLDAGGAVADPPILVDAHSQIDHHVDRATIVPLMDAAGVRHVILSARGKVKPEQITAFAAQHPDRVTASVRTKGGHFSRNTDKFYTFLEKQLSMPGFGAMSEAILWHARKGDKAPEVVVPPDAPQVTKSLAGAMAKGWPFVIHIEFAATSDYETFMTRLEALLDRYLDHPFALIHMGQLEAKEAGRLLAAHGNLHFLTSHANPIVKAGSNQPWVDLFDGGDVLAPRWKALFVGYPDRFVLAFDNVWENHWGDYYVRQAALWRDALADLPHAVAHAVAHGNAERLWRLPTVR